LVIKTYFKVKVKKYLKVLVGTLKSIIKQLLLISYCTTESFETQMVKVLTKHFPKASFDNQMVILDF
jgi:hypothetical protein